MNSQSGPPFSARVLSRRPELNWRHFEFQSLSLHKAHEILWKNICKKLHKNDVFTLSCCSSSVGVGGFFFFFFFTVAYTGSSWGGGAWSDIVIVLQWRKIYFNFATRILQLLKICCLKKLFVRKRTSAQAARWYLVLVVDVSSWLWLLSLLLSSFLLVVVSRFLQMPCYLVLRNIHKQNVCSS